MNIDYTETYLELINQLNENAIKILHIHNKYHEEFLKNGTEHKEISLIMFSIQIDCSSCFIISSFNKPIK